MNRAELERARIVSGFLLSGPSEVLDYRIATRRQELSRLAPVAHVSAGPPAAASDLEFLHRSPA